MRIRIKLTILSDLDLITLHCIPEFDFKAWVRNALRVYAGSRDVLKTPLPAPPESLSPENLMLSITFDRVKDAIVLEWLSSIRGYQRSGAIKSLLRCCLENPCLYACHSDFPVVFPAQDASSRKKPRKAPVSDGAHEESSYYPPAAGHERTPKESEQDDFDIFSFPTDGD